jgi:Winged helix DNA-binding domain
MKTYFAPIPLRAIGDPRLTGLHLKVLAVISYHDRFSHDRKTPGCFTSHKNLCAKVGCNYTNFSAAVGDLIKWGYLVRVKQKKDKRLNLYRVQHDRQKNSWSIGKLSAEIVCPNRKVVCPATLQTVENKNGKALKRALEKRT